MSEVGKRRNLASRQAARIVTGGLVAALVGCGTPVPSVDPTPEAVRSISPEDTTAADAVVDRFMAIMAEPNLTYRVRTQLNAEVGDTTLSVMGRYYVRGHDYGAQVHLNGIPIDPTVGADLQLVVMGDTAHLIGYFQNEPTSMDAPASLRRPDAVQGLGADDLVLIGPTDDGLLEFQVLPWLEGDPLGEWIDLAGTAGAEPPRTELKDHETRLFLNEAGQPQRLRTSWSFMVPAEDANGRGTITDEFEGFGMYVSIAAPGQGQLITSYDVIVGVGADHVVITEPWVEISPPAADAARLEVHFEFPGHPITLGMEGAIGFVRSHAADGSLALDHIIGMEDDVVSVPTGTQTLVVYYRPCDGSCSLLDPPNDFCTVPVEVEADAVLRLTVDVHDASRATCELSVGG